MSGESIGDGVAEPARRVRAGSTGPREGDYWLGGFGNSRRVPGLKVVSRKFVGDCQRMLPPIRMVQRNWCPSPSSIR